MISTVTTMNYDDLIAYMDANGYILPPEVAVISILDPGTVPVNARFLTHVHRFEFLDLDVRQTTPTNLIAGCRTVGGFPLTFSQARKIAKALWFYYFDQRSWHLLVQCMAGVSRSVSIAAAINWLQGEGPVSKEALEDVPNLHVFYLLIGALAEEMGIGKT